MNATPTNMFATKHPDLHKAKPKAKAKMNRSGQRTPAEQVRLVIMRQGMYRTWKPLFNGK